jgi:hypothetical protein
MSNKAHRRPQTRKIAEQQKSNQDSSGLIGTIQTFIRDVWIVDVAKDKRSCPWYQIEM